MNQTSLFCDDERTLLVPNTSPTVFVVDDDISVRESLEFLIRNASTLKAILEVYAGMRLGGFLAPMIMSASEATGL